MSHRPRVAIGAFMLESNSHSPVATREEFMANCHLESDAFAQDWRAPHPQSPATVSGFVAAMDGTGAWQGVPLLCTHVGASGPVDQAFFDDVVARMCAHLRAALPVDAVYLSLHGAAIATADDDPDGTLLARVREVVGPGIPVVATLDLHGNIVQRMVDHASVLVAYRENPHTDMAERGAESARIVHEMLRGMRPTAAFVKLPFIPPSVTQNTKRGPYADLIAFGQSRMDAGVVNVSILSGFTSGDTSKNGMSVIVTTRDDGRQAHGLAREIAARAWSERRRYVPDLTSLADAVRMALTAGRDPSAPALLFADVADNPGGGGRGNTVWILQAFHEAGVNDAWLGIFFDPRLAAEAHRLGVGASFRAEFNRDEAQPLSGRYAADAVVEGLHDGRCVGRRGISAGHAIVLGPSALLRVGGLRVIVVSVRQQCKDPVFFEMFGLDLRGARSLIVKSRGHFRAAFDEFFPDECIIEVDVPGLTTPVLQNVPWQRVPRPIYPLDPDMAWAPPTGVAAGASPA